MRFPRRAPINQSDPHARQGWARPPRPTAATRRFRHGTLLVIRTHSPRGERVAIHFDAHAAAVDAGWRVGIPPLKNSAIRAKMASTESAVRSPSIRAVAFSWTMASAVFGGTWASLSAVFNCASEMNGAPPASWVVAWDLDAVGNVGVVLDAVQERGGQGGDDDRAGQGSADRHAEVRDRVLQAADLAALLVGDRRTR